MASSYRRTLAAWYMRTHRWRKAGLDVDERDRELIAFLVRLGDLVGQSGPRGHMETLKQAARAWRDREPGDVWCITERHQGWLQPMPAAQLCRREPAAIMVPA